jgi:hypothetical protein
MHTAAALEARRADAVDEVALARARLDPRDREMVGGVGVLGGTDVEVFAARERGGGREGHQRDEEGELHRDDVRVRMWVMVNEDQEARGWGTVLY